MYVDTYVPTLIQYMYMSVDTCTYVHAQIRRMRIIHTPGHVCRYICAHIDTVHVHVCRYMYICACTDTQSEDYTHTCTCM